ncbi:hypothetical protein ANTPLA_LOCUS748 [Anthophora plagiata]
MANADSVQTERDLIRKRATIKSKLTVFAKFIESCQESEDIRLDQLKLRIARLEKEFVMFDSVQQALELSASDSDYEIRLSERTEFEDQYYEVLAIATRIARDNDKAHGQALNKPFLEAFPIYAITNKLDEQTRLRWKERTQGIDLPTMEDLLDFLHKRRRVLETTKIEPSRPITRSNQEYAYHKLRNRGSTNTNVRTLAHPAQPARCFMCKANHFTQYCQKLTNANIDQRVEMVRNAGLCNNCLRPNHDIKDCTAGSCKRCNGKHHTLLHTEQQPVRANVTALSVKIENETLLSTALVYIRDNKGHLQSCRVLLDSGAQSHFITERFAKLLSLALQKTDIPVGKSQLRTTP